MRYITHYLYLNLVAIYLELKYNSSLLFAGSVTCPLGFLVSKNGMIFNVLNMNIYILKNSNLLINSILIMYYFFIIIIFFKVHHIVIFIMLSIRDEQFAGKIVFLPDSGKNWKKWARLNKCSKIK